MTVLPAESVKVTVSLYVSLLLFADRFVPFAQPESVTAAIISIIFFQYFFHVIFLLFLLIKYFTTNIIICQEKVKLCQMPI